MAINTQDIAQNTVETYGWDTIFAIDIEQLNTAISEVTEIPQSLDLKSSGMDVTIDFGKWTIGNGGDGKIINFILPIMSGNLNMGSHSINIPEGNAILEVELDFFDTDNQTNDPNISTKHLKLSQSKTNSEGNSPVTVTKVEFDKTNNDVILQGLLLEKLQDWIDTNIHIFDVIFATVNLSNSIDTGNFSWVKPTSVDYAFISNEDQSKSYLGILSMTEGRSTNGLTPQLSPFTLIPKSSLGYLISSERCLTKLIKPSVTGYFTGLKSNALTLSKDETALNLAANSSIPIEIKHKGKTYDCKLQDLDISITGNQFKIHFKSETEIDLDITSHIESTHTYNIIEKTLSNGKKSIAYNQVGKPVVNKWTTQPEGYEIAEIVIAIIAAIVIIILGILTDGAAFIIGALIIGLISGLAMATPKIISTVGKDDAPDLNLLTTNINKPIIWPGQNKFNLTSAQLNGCLQLSN